MSATLPPSGTLSPAIGDERILKSHVILCEGKDDLSFLNAFIWDRGIAANLQVMKTGEGKSGFRKRLELLKQLGELDYANSLVLIADNDEKPNDSFKDIVQQIKDVGDLPVPIQRLRIAVKKGQPAISIVMMPWRIVNGKMRGDKAGDLETVIFEMLEKEYPDQSICLEEYVKCTEVSNWDVSQQSKMRLVCLIAATCKRDPECPPVFMWQSNKKYKHLLKNPMLDPLADFLKKVSKRVDKKREDQLRLRVP